MRMAHRSENSHSERMDGDGGGKVYYARRTKAQTL